MTCGKPQVIVLMKIRVSDTPFIGESPQNRDNLIRKHISVKLCFKLILADTALDQAAEYPVDIPAVNGQPYFRHSFRLDLCIL